MKIPTNCSCGAVLILHCGSHTCQWLRCPNPRCDWTNLDVERGIRLSSDGHCEALT